MKKEHKVYLNKVSRRLRYLGRICFWFTMIGIFSVNVVNFKPIFQMVGSFGLIWIIIQIYNNMFDLIKYWNKEEYY